MPTFLHKSRTSIYVRIFILAMSMVIRSVSAPRLTDPRLVIHSLRRGGITKLHRAGVPVNIAEVITGHTEGTEHEKYVHRELISMKTLQEALENLQFPRGS